MARLEKNDRIKINQNEHKVSDLLKTLIYLPSQTIKNWFDQIGLSVPRQVRISVLKNTLREQVLRTRIERKTLADELNYRLSWFNEFTESQLENLLVFYNDEKLDKEFYELLWVELINYFVSKNVPEHNFSDLIDLSIKNVKDTGLKLEDTKVFNKTLSPIFFDRRNEIDGLPLEKIRPVLYKSSTLVEIRQLGTKYGVNVPKRLKKNELADIVVNELKDREQHTQDEEAKVRNMSILVLQRYAKDNDIKASTELKKEEIIEYILKNANETRETYFIPETSDVYQEEFNDLTELPDEVEPVEEEVVEVLEEPQIEEEIEAVVEKVEERVLVSQNVNLDELVAEIKLLRQAIETKETNIIVSNDEKVESSTSDRKSFDTSKVETTHLESVSYTGNKKTWKKVNKDFNNVVEDVEEIKPEPVAEQAILPNHFEVFVAKDSNRNIAEFKIFRFLLMLLVILLIIAVVAAVIAGFFLTPTTGIGFVDTIIEFLNNLFGR